MGSIHKILPLATLLASVYISAVPITGPEDKCALACVESLSDNGKFQYELGQTYVYDYETETTTELEGASSDRTSLRISAKVEIEAFSKCELNLILREVSLLENGNPSAGSHDFATKLEAHPLRFAWVDGKIESVCPTFSEDVRVLNMKKAILSSMQNSLPSLAIDNGASVTVKEVDLAGSCDTTYTRENHLLGGMRLSKTKDLLGCTERYGNVSSIQTDTYKVPSQFQSLPITKSEHSCVQEISNGLISSSQCSETHRFRPFSKQNAGAVTRTTQSLVFNTMLNTVDSRLSPVETRTSLLFEHNYGYGMTSNARLDVESTLESLCTQTAVDVRPDTPTLFAQLLHQMRRLETTDFLSVLSSVNNGRICTHHRGKQFFFDAIPLVGTAASTRAMVNLLKDGTVTGVEADMWLAQMSFMQNPTLEVLEHAQELVTDARLRDQSALAVSTIVHTYCNSNSDCPSRTPVQAITRALEDVILGTGCDTSSPGQRLSVIIAMKALGNMGHALRSATPFMRCMQKTDADAEVRVAALSAYRRLPCTISREEPMELFRNMEIDSEIRIGAYLAVMTCPTASSIEQVKMMLSGEKVNQVGSFVWTHLTNLAESASVHKADARDLLNDLLLNEDYADKDGRMFSRNVEKSIFSEYLNAGATAESNLIWSQDSYVPRSAMMNLTVDMFGNSVNLLEMGGRVQGLETLLERYFGPDGYFSQENVRSLLGREKDIPDYMRVIEALFKINKDEQLSASAYVKFFGNEIRYMDLAAFLGDSQSVSRFAIEFMQKIAEPMESHFGRSTEFMHTSLIVPTLGGLPLNFTVEGTATIDVDMSGKLDMRNSRSIDINGSIKPSVAVVFNGEMSVDALVASTSMSMKTTMHSSTALEGKIQFMPATGKFAVDYNMPRNRMDIFSVDSKFYLNGQEMSMPQANDMVMKSCTGESIKAVLGVELCTDVSLPQIHGEGLPLAPFTGPFSLKQYLTKVDTHDKYTVSAEFEHVAAGNSNFKFFTKLMADTPGSKVDRKMLMLVDMDQANRMVTGKFITPWKKMTVTTEVTGTDAQTMMTATLLMDQTTRYQVIGEYGLEEKKNRDIYSPRFTIVMPGMDPMVVEGSVSLGTKKPVDFEFSTNMGPGPMSLKGSVTVMKNAETVESELALVSPWFSGSVGGQAKWIAGGYSTESQLTYDLMAGAPAHTLRFTHKLQAQTSDALDDYQCRFGLSSDKHDYLNWAVTTTFQRSENILETKAVVKQNSSPLFVLEHRMEKSGPWNNPNQLGSSTEFSLAPLEIDYKFDVRHLNNGQKFVTAFVFTNSGVITRFGWNLEEALESTGIITGELRFEHNGDLKRIAAELTKVSDLEYTLAKFARWGPHPLDKAILTTTLRKTEAGQYKFSTNLEYSPYPMQFEGSVRPDPKNFETSFKTTQKYGTYEGNMQWTVTDNSGFFITSIVTPQKTYGVNGSLKKKANGKIAGQVAATWKTGALAEESAQMRVTFHDTSDNTVNAHKLVTSLMYKGANVISYTQEMNSAKDFRQLTYTSKTTMWDQRPMNERFEYSLSDSQFSAELAYNDAHITMTNRATAHFEQMSGSLESSLTYMESEYSANVIVAHNEGSYSATMRAPELRAGASASVNDMRATGRAHWNEEEVSGEVAVVPMRSVDATMRMMGKTYEAHLRHEETDTSFTQTMDFNMDSNVWHANSVVQISGPYSWTMEAATPMAGYERLSGQIKFEGNSDQFETSVRASMSDDTMSGKLMYSPLMSSVEFVTPWQTQTARASYAHTMTTTGFENRVNAEWGTGQSISSVVSWTNPESGYTGSVVLRTPWEIATKCEASVVHAARSSGWQNTLSVEWALAQKMTLDVSHDNSNNRMTTSVTLETPFKIAQKWEASATHQCTDNSWENTASVKWASGQEMSTTASFTNSESQMSASATLRTPFKAAQKWEATMEHPWRPTGFENRMTFEWATGMSASSHLSYSNSNSGVSTAATVEAPGYKWVASGEHTWQAHGWENRATFEWETGKSVTTLVSFANSPSELTTSASVEIPMYKWESNMRHQYTDNGFENRLTVAWPTNQEFSTVVTFSNSEMALSTSATIQSSFEMMRRWETSVAHQRTANGWENTASVLWAPGQEMSTTTSFTNSQSQMSASATLRTPFKAAQKWETSVAHLWTANGWENTASVLWAPGQQMTGVASFVIGETGVTTTITLRTPFEVAQKWEASLRHQWTTNGWTTRSAIEWATSQEVVVSTSFGASDAGLSTSFSVDTPFEGLSRLEKTFEHSWVANGFSTEAKLILNRVNTYSFNAEWSTAGKYSGSATLSTPHEEMRRATAQFEHTGETLDSFSTTASATVGSFSPMQFTMSRSSTPTHCTGSVRLGNSAEFISAVYTRQSSDSDCRLTSTVSYTDMSFTSTNVMEWDAAGINKASMTVETPFDNFQRMLVSYTKRSGTGVTHKVDIALPYGKSVELESVESFSGWERSAKVMGFSDAYSLVVSHNLVGSAYECRAVANWAGMTASATSTLSLEPFSHTVSIRTPFPGLLELDTTVSNTGSAADFTTHVSVGWTPAANADKVVASLNVAHEGSLDNFRTRVTGELNGNALAASAQIRADPPFMEATVTSPENGINWVGRVSSTMETDGFEGRFTVGWSDADRISASVHASSEPPTVTASLETPFEAAHNVNGRVTFTTGEAEFNHQGSFEWAADKKIEYEIDVKSDPLTVSASVITPWKTVAFTGTHETGPMSLAHTSELRWDNTNVISLRAGYGAKRGHFTLTTPWEEVRSVTFTVVDSSMSDLNKVEITTGLNGQELYMAQTWRYTAASGEFGSTVRDRLFTAGTTAEQTVTYTISEAGFEAAYEATYQGQRMHATVSHNPSLSRATFTSPFEYARNLMASLKHEGSTIDNFDWVATVQFADNKEIRAKAAVDWVDTKTASFQYSCPQYTVDAAFSRMAADNRASLKLTWPESNQMDAELTLSVDDAVSCTWSASSTAFTPVSGSFGHSLESNSETMNFKLEQHFNIKVDNAPWVSLVLEGERTSPECNHKFEMSTPWNVFSVRVNEKRMIGEATERSMTVTWAPEQTVTVTVAYKPEPFEMSATVVTPVEGYENWSFVTSATKTGSKWEAMAKFVSPMYNTMQLSGTFDQEPIRFEATFTAPAMDMAYTVTHSLDFSGTGFSERSTFSWSSDAKIVTVSRGTWESLNKHSLTVTLSTPFEGFESMTGSFERDCTSSSSRHVASFEWAPEQKVTVSVDLTHVLTPSVDVSANVNLNTPFESASSFVGAFEIKGNRMTSSASLNGERLFIVSSELRAESDLHLQADFEASTLKMELAFTFNDNMFSYDTSAEYDGKRVHKTLELNWTTKVATLTMTAPWFMENLRVRAQHDGSLTEFRDEASFSYGDMSSTATATFSLSQQRLTINITKPAIAFAFTHDGSIQERSCTASLTATYEGETFAYNHNIQFSEAKQGAKVEVSQVPMSVMEPFTAQIWREKATDGTYEIRGSWKTSYEFSMRTDASVDERVWTASHEVTVKTPIPGWEDNSFGFNYEHRPKVFHFNVNGHKGAGTNQASCTVSVRNTSKQSRTAYEWELETNHAAFPMSFTGKYFLNYGKDKYGYNGKVVAFNKVVESRLVVNHKWIGEELEHTGEMYNSYTDVDPMVRRYTWTLTKNDMSYMAELTGVTDSAPSNKMVLKVEAQLATGMTIESSAKIPALSVDTGFHLDMRGNMEKFEFAGRAYVDPNAPMTTTFNYEGGDRMTVAATLSMPEMPNMSFNVATRFQEWPMGLEMRGAYGTYAAEFSSRVEDAITLSSTVSFKSSWTDDAMFTITNERVNAGPWTTRLTVSYGSQRISVSGELTPASLEMTVTTPFEGFRSTHMEMSHQLTGSEAWQGSFRLSMTALERPIDVSASASMAGTVSLTLSTPWESLRSFELSGSVADLNRVNFEVSHNNTNLGKISGSFHWTNWMVNSGNFVVQIPSLSVSFNTMFNNDLDFSDNVMKQELSLTMDAESWTWEYNNHRDASTGRITVTADLKTPPKCVGDVSYSLTYAGVMNDWNQETNLSFNNVQMRIKSEGLVHETRVHYKEESSWTIFGSRGSEKTNFDWTPSTFAASYMHSDILEGDTIRLTWSLEPKFSGSLQFQQVLMEGEYQLTDDSVSLKASLTENSVVTSVETTVTLLTDGAQGTISLRDRRATHIITFHSTPTQGSGSWEVREGTRVELFSYTYQGSSSGMTTSGSYKSNGETVMSWNIQTDLEPYRFVWNTYAGPANDYTYSIRLEVTPARGSFKVQNREMSGIEFVFSNEETSGEYGSSIVLRQLREGSVTDQFTFNGVYKNEGSGKQRDFKLHFVGPIERPYNVDFKLDFLTLSSEGVPGQLKWYMAYNDADGDRDELLDMVTEWGNDKVIMRFVQPQPMEYSVDATIGMRSTSLRWVANWDTTAPHSNVVLDAMYRVPSQSVANAQVAITYKGSVYEFESTSDLQENIAKQNVLFDFVGHKFGYAVELERDGMSMTKGMLKLTTPLRTLQWKAEHTESSTTHSDMVSFAWDLERNADKMVSARFMMENEGSSQRTTVTLHHPALERDFEYTNIMSRVNGGYDNLNNIIYSNDSRKKVTFRVISSAQTPLKVVLKHPFSSINWQYTLQMANSGEGLSLDNEMSFSSEFKFLSSVSGTTKSIALTAEYKDMTVTVTGITPMKTVRVHAQLNNRSTADATVFDFQISCLVNGDSDAVLRLRVDEREPKMELLVDHNSSNVFEAVAEKLADSPRYQVAAYHNHEGVRHEDFFTSVGLNSSELASCRVHWRPETSAEIKEIVNDFRTELMAEVDVALEAAMQEEFMVPQPCTEMAALVAYSQTEMELAQEQIAEASQQLKAMYDNNDLYMRSAFEYILSVYETVEEFLQTWQAEWIVFTDTLTATYESQREAIQNARAYVRESFANMDTAILRQLASSYEQFMTSAYEKATAFLDMFDSALSAIDQMISDLKQQIIEHPYAETVAAAHAQALAWVDEYYRVAYEDYEQALAAARVQYAAFVDFQNAMAASVTEAVSDTWLAGILDMINLPEALGYLRSKAEFFYEYYEVEEHIVSALTHAKEVAKESVNKAFDQYVDELMTVIKFTHWDPVNGEIRAEARLPVQLISLINNAEMPAVNFDMYANRMSAAVRGPFTAWRQMQPMSHFRSACRKGFLPPFDVKGLITGQHITTFDGKHYDFKGSSCSYLLAHDFDDGNFTALVNYRSDRTQSVTIRTNGREIEIAPAFMVLVDGAKSELPIEFEDTKVTREGETVVLEYTKGLTVICNSGEVCLFRINGMYFGKTGGLFGTYNNEQHDDFTTRNNAKVTDVTEFVRSWGVGDSCATQNIAVALSPSETNEQCEALFMSEDSVFAPAFLRVSPQDSFRRCVVDMRSSGHDGLCGAAKNYAFEALDAGVYVSMPSECASCSLPSDTLTRGESATVAPVMSADVVVVVEEKRCNEAAQAKLAGWAKELNYMLKQQGLNDNLVSLVGFGGQGVHSLPHVHTSIREIFGRFSTFRSAVETLQFSDAGSNDDAMTAVKYAATRMPFRPGVAKAIVLLTCSDCSDSRMSHWMINSMLQKMGISFHVALEHKFETTAPADGTPQTTTLYGIDDKAFYTAKDAAKFAGDEELYQSLIRPDNQCVDLALSNNGCAFDLTKMTMSAPRDNKKMSLVWATRVAQSIAPEQCQTCSCMYELWSGARTVCRKC